MGKSKTIALSLFNARISPRFDHAPSVLIVSVSADGTVGEQHEFFCRDCSALERINQLTALDVDIIICGGISKEVELMLNGNNIKVIPWVTGNAIAALDLFLRGRLRPGTMVCPGKKPGRWRFCSQRSSNRHEPQ